MNMFTKKPDDGAQKIAPRPVSANTAGAATRQAQQSVRKRTDPSSPPSFLSNHLFIKGNVQSDSDIEIEGRIEGDVRAQTLKIGEKAVISGQVMANEVIIDGRVNGQVRGTRVRLNKLARVEGDIVHEAIAIESGAHFEGTIKREEDPMKQKAASAQARDTAPQSAQQPAAQPTRPAPTGVAPKKT